MNYTASMVHAEALAAALAAPIESAADWVKSSHGFAKIRTADGGAVYLKNAAERLREFAETVRKNWSAYGGAARPAGLLRRAAPARMRACLQAQGRPDARYPSSRRFPKPLTSGAHHAKVATPQMATALAH